MKRKRFRKYVSLVLCTAMVTAMGGIPVLAETVDNAYEYAFTDADQLMSPDSFGKGVIEQQEMDMFSGEESNRENLEYKGFSSGDAVEVNRFSDSDVPVAQAEERAVVYLDPQSGNDENSGESSTEAVKTLEHARTLVNDGGIIYLLSGVEINSSYLLENVTLCPGNDSMTYLLSVKAGAELALKNVKVNNITPDNSNCAFSQNPIQVYGTLQVEENTEIGPFPGKSCIMANNGSTVNINGGKLLGSGEESDRAESSCGIYAYGAKVNMAGGMITGQVAKYGGGIYADNSTVTLTGGSIIGNLSGQGAGIYLSNSKLFMKSGEDGKSCQITGNTVKTDHNQYIFGEGGGIYLYNSTANITEGTIAENKAIEEYSDEGTWGGVGGAIVVLQSNVTIDGSVVIRDNSADSRGGAIYLEGKNASASASLSVQGGTISGNKAGGSGGGIFAQCYCGDKNGAKVTVSGGKITGNYLGSDMAEENAIMLMGDYADEPNENTGFANLYLSGSPEITGSVVFGDNTDSNGKAYGPLIYADSSLSVKTPVLIVPTYGTPGSTAVVYDDETTAEAYKQQFCSEKNGSRGLVKDENTLKWVKKMKVELLTFINITSKLEYTRKNIYVLPGEVVDPADIPERSKILGYEMTGWRNQGADRTPWDPTSAITTDMRVQEVWTLVKPTVKVTADREKGCPSTAVILTAQAEHVRGDITFNYEWYKDGAPIEGQTEATLTVSEAGEYKVLVLATSQAGAKASEQASVSIPAFEHSYTWQFDEKTHWQLCDIGGEKTAAEAHTFGNWVVTKPAAVSVTGEKERTCETCAYKEKEEIPALYPPSYPVTGIKVFPDILTLVKKDETVQLTAEVSPSYADNKRVLWKSSDAKVVTVDVNGKVTAVANGTATITATSVSGSYTANVTVTVKIPIEIEKITVAAEKEILTQAGETTELKVKIEPENADPQKMIWKSSDEKVATVDENGKVTAVSNGTATITVTTEDGKHSAEVTVTVKIPVEIEKLTLTAKKETLTQIGESTELEVKIEPENADPQKFIWKSSNEKVAVVDENGKVTAVGNGTATITVATENGKQEASVKITVKVPEEPVINNITGFGRLRTRSVKQTKTSVTLQWNRIKGADGYLIYGNRCNTNGKSYKYKKLATITNGKTQSWTQEELKKGTFYKYIVKAYKLVDGKKVIIDTSVSVHAITQGGKYGIAKSVTVSKLGSKKNTLEITLKKGETAQITAKEVKNDNKIKQHRKLCYESSNTKVATVTSKGLIRAKGKGTCTIWVYAQNGVYKAITVTVK